MARLLFQDTLPAQPWPSLSWVNRLGGDRVHGGFLQHSGDGGGVVVGCLISWEGGRSKSDYHLPDACFESQHQQRNRDSEVCVALSLLFNLGPTPKRKDELGSLGCEISFLSPGVGRER